MSREVAVAQRQQRVAAVAAIERQMVSAHLPDFPKALPPGPVKTDMVLSELVAASTAGIGWAHFLRRRKARAAARAAAPEVAEQRYKQAAGAYALLADNDPATVLHSLEGVFEDNEHPAAPIDCREGIATVLLVFPPADMIPQDAPATTPGGRPTLHKRSEQDRQRLYSQALGSTVLATVKEAYATCPFLRDLKVVVVCRDPDAATPNGVLAAIYAGRFPADRVAAMAWAKVDPVEQLLTAPDALFNRVGASKKVSPLSLQAEPELQALLDQLRSQL